MEKVEFFSNGISIAVNETITVAEREVISTATIALSNQLYCFRGINGGKNEQRVSNRFYSDLIKYN